MALQAAQQCVAPSGQAGRCHRASCSETSRSCAGLSSSSHRRRAQRARRLPAQAAATVETSVPAPQPMAPRSARTDANQPSREGAHEAPLVVQQAQKQDPEQPALGSVLPAFDAAATADVAVVGAGPAGLALAAELAQQGLSVVLVSPESKFVNNYGVWLDEFKDLGLEHTLDTGGRLLVCWRLVQGGGWRPLGAAGRLWAVRSGAGCGMDAAGGCSGRERIASSAWLQRCWLTAGRCQHARACLLCLSPLCLTCPSAPALHQSAVWDDAVCFFKEQQAVRVGRPYGRVCRRRLREHLVARCAAAGVAYLEAEVADASSSPSDQSAHLGLADGRRLSCRLAVLASGQAAGKLLKYEAGVPPVAAQTAYGIEAEVEGYGDSYPTDAMLFMDFRRHHTGLYDGTANRCAHAWAWWWGVCQGGGLAPRARPALPCPCWRRHATAPAMLMCGAPPLLVRPPRAAGSSPARASTARMACGARRRRCRRSCMPCRWAATACFWRRPAWWRGQPCRLPPSSGGWSGAAARWASRWGCWEAGWLCVVCGLGRGGRGVGRLAAAYIGRRTGGAQPSHPPENHNALAHARAEPTGMAALRLRSCAWQVKEVHEEEWSYIPVGGPLPLPDQPVAAYGAAASLVHPGAQCVCTVVWCCLAGRPRQGLRQHCGNF